VTIGFSFDPDACETTNLFFSSPKKLTQQCFYPSLHLLLDSLQASVARRGPETSNGSVDDLRRTLTGGREGRKNRGDGKKKEKEA